jgi:exodeoxyribonuclease VII small subunit
MPHERPKDDAAAPAALPDPLGFEEALERLEAIVDGLEGGELALEDALARFEEGVGLTRALGEQLTRAERRVEQLVREGGGLAVKPLGEDAT